MQPVRIGIVGAVANTRGRHLPRFRAIDEAGASLVSYFCRLSAKPIGHGETPAYTISLLQAKRWVREQPK